ncbi:hypothetical protein PVK06_012822 [Gossypium arboreum]|uniref:Uncharacterized protein n=1 Tax=Gossypium arboreum TaxID=29729 RepID=A0ABR0QCS8_GOSAR|nr:hypothetical protein PVK06_012822 [Gossypium arboreum]
MVVASVQLILNLFVLNRISVMLLCFLGFSTQISRIDLARWTVLVFSFSIDPLCILLKFLMGLNKTYVAVQNQILLMQPLPSVNQAYFMIVQQKDQMSFSSVLSHALDLVALSFTASRNRKKFISTCDFCKLKGHKKESYYELIGFSLDFKFNRKKASQPAVAIYSDESPLSPQAVLSLQRVPVFTPQQYSQILELLNKNQAAIAPAVNCADVNCAIIFYPDFCLLQDLSNARMKGIDSKFLFIPTPIPSTPIHFSPINPLPRTSSTSSSTIPQSVPTSVSTSHPSLSSNLSIVELRRFSRTIKPPS